MTTLSSEAERLAAFLEQFKTCGHQLEDGTPVHLAAAALLRRIPELEAERDQLRAELEGRWLPIESAPDGISNARVSTSQDNGKWRVVVEFDQHADASALHTWLMDRGVAHGNIDTSADQAQQPAGSDVARDAVVNAGGQLANIAFNLKQRVGHTISTHDAEAMDRCLKAWDSATASDAARQREGE